MPDIDLDFDERRRGDMIRYATEKYGEERVAQIITYGTIKAKQAVKDSARVLGFPFAMGDRITKAMPPPVMGKDVPLAGIFDTSHPRYREAGEFRTLYETDPDVEPGRRQRARAGGAQAAVGRARRRRDPVQGAAPRRHPDHAPRAGRRDHHAVRHGRLRDPRAAEDGLPRAAQPHRARRLPRQHRGQPRRDDRARDARPRRPQGLRAARRRRHARRLPARRRPDALAAAVDEAGQLRGHLRCPRALPARPDGRQRPQRLRRPQERPASPSSPCIPSSRSRWPRSSATPTA